MLRRGAVRTTFGAVRAEDALREEVNSREFMVCFEFMSWQWKEGKMHVMSLAPGLGFDHRSQTVNVC